MPKQILTQQYVQRRLSYNKDTGILTWNTHTKIHKIGKSAGSVNIKPNKRTSYMYLDLQCNRYFVHRIIWLHVYGYMPCNCIDHIDGCGSNNKLANLREVTNLVNSHNMRIAKNNTSGTTGVIKFNDKYWRAQICVNGKHLKLGYFINKKDAITTRKMAEIKFGFHKNHGTIKNS